MTSHTSKGNRSISGGELTNILLKINGTRRCISYRTSPFFGGEMLNFRGVGIWLMPAFWCWGYWLLIPASTCVLEFDAASWHTLRLSYVLCGTGGFIELLRLSQAGQGANFASQSEGHSPVWESLATKLDLMWWDRVFFGLFVCLTPRLLLMSGVKTFVDSFDTGMIVRYMIHIL